jgi:hypothetical protein
MRRREQYSMFATLAGSKLSLLITDVMSSNSWILCRVVGISNWFLYHLIFLLFLQ